MSLTYCSLLVNKKAISYRIENHFNLRFCFESFYGIGFASLALAYYRKDCVATIFVFLKSFVFTYILVVVVGLGVIVVAGGEWVVSSSSSPSSLSFWSTPRSPSPPPLIVGGGRGSPGVIDDDDSVVTLTAAVAEVEFDDGDDMTLNRRILLSIPRTYKYINMLFTTIKTSTMNPAPKINRRNNGAYFPRVHSTPDSGSSQFVGVRSYETIG